jgi:hypothetical protein
MLRLRVSRLRVWRRWLIRLLGLLLSGARSWARLWLLKVRANVRRNELWLEWNYGLFGWLMLFLCALGDVGGIVDIRTTCTVVKT